MDPGSVEGWALIRRLDAEGMSQRQVARDLGIGRSTVGRPSPRLGHPGTSGRRCPPRSRRSSRWFASFWALPR
ncbi:helix-turn-helix domain-containing protein [Kineosphaera limosa]|uniref:helix-turn-helix domain-containing protein n=1 Tax=Kineosphaera limosa TaxID=111564 RepID=UPI003B83764E